MPDPNTGWQAPSAVSSSECAFGNGGTAILIASIESLGMQPSWPAAVFAAFAVALGIGIAVVRDRSTGMAIVAGGVLVAALVLVALSTSDAAGREPTLGPLFAWFAAAILVTLIAFQGGSVPRDANDLSRLFHILVIPLVIGGLIFGAGRPEQVGPSAAAVGGMLVAALHPICRLIAVAAAVRLVFSISAPSSLYWILQGAGPILLAGAVFEIYLRWRFRRRVWLSDSDQLLRTRTISTWQLIFVWVLAAALGVGVLEGGGSILSVTALACSAIGLLTFGHLAASPATGEAGLALAAATLAAAVVLFAGLGALPAAMALAGLWMMWLARFWNQQLLDGVPWTTAGRLIPSARRIGAAAAFALLLLSCKTPAPGSFSAVVALVLALALAAALTVAARRERCGGSAIGALAAGGAVAILTLGMLPDATPAYLAPPIGAAIAAVLGWPAAGSRNKDGEMARAAWIGIGAVTLIGLAISRPEEPQLFVAASITLAAGLLLAALSRRSPAPVDSQS